MPITDALIKIKNLLYFWGSFDNLVHLFAIINSWLKQDVFKLHLFRLINFLQLFFLLLFKIRIGVRVQVAVKLLTGNIVEFELVVPMFLVLLNCIKTRTQILHKLGDRFLVL